MTPDEAVALIAERLSAGEVCPAAGICLLLLRGCPWDAVDDAWTLLASRIVGDRGASVVADIDEAIRRATQGAPA